MASKEDSSNDSNGPGGPNAKDDIYEDRPMAKKVIRIVTVVAYLVSVSFVAIVLSAYYIFLWRPPPGGSLSLRDPHAEYLMESPPERSNNNRSISEIIEKINLFRKNTVRGFNRTRSPTTSSSPLHDGSKNVGSLVKMMASLRRKNPEPSTGVYDSITSKIDVLSTTLEDLNHASESSTVEGDDERNITDFKGIQQNLDDYNASVETTSPQGINEKTTVKPNATDASHKPKQIYSPIYIDEDQPIERPTELEASLDPLPTMNPTSSEYQEDISEENVEEPLDIEFDGA